MTTPTRRVIRKDGLLYKLAYGRLKEENRPTGTVNLFDIVWSAMISMLGLIFIGLFAIVFLCLAAIAVVFIGSLVWLISASVIAWLADLHLPSISHQDAYVFVVVVSASVFFFGVAATVAWGVPAFAKSETGRLLAAYLKAKKEKICPIYEVVE